MKTIKFKNNILLSSLTFLIFFIINFFYFFLFAGYQFFYQEKLSLFIFSADFFREHFSQPGGFITYISVFLKAFYHYKFAGAVILSLTLLLVVIISVEIEKTLTQKPFFIFSFLIGGGLSFLHTHYQFQLVNSLGVLFQLLMFYTAIVLCEGKRSWIFVLIFPVWYYLTGGFAWFFLIFYSLDLLIETDKKRLFQLVTLIFLAGLSFYVSKEFLFYRTGDALLKYPVSEIDTGNQLKGMMVIFILILLLPLLKTISRFLEKRKDVNLYKWSWLFSFFMVVVLGAALTWQIDRKNMHYFHVEKLFYEKRFNEIIEFNKDYPSNNRLTLFLNNIALAETGQLTERMFEFSQSSDGGTLFLDWEIIGEVLRRGGYYYYSIGLINEAHRWAYEYMVMHGYTPEGLKMLVKTELINGNYKTASKYIDVLSKTLFYRKDACKFKKLIDDDEAVNNHPELGMKKRLKPEKDFFVLSAIPAANLEPILEADSSNYMAAEYWFAWLLLQKDVSVVTENLALLEKAGYKKIPRYIDEAATSFRLLRIGEFPQLQCLRTNVETERQFKQYYKIFQQSNNNMERAERALYTDFSDSFWYYLFFN